ncbi:MAG: hypothetical protein SynsKO_05840 [Synoicihabitans sp.]
MPRFENLVPSFILAFGVLGFCSPNLKAQSITSDQISSSSISTGDTFTVTVSGKNTWGSRASQGGITIQITNAEDKDDEISIENVTASGASQVFEKWRGDSLSNGAYTADYVHIEPLWENWSAQSTKTVSVRFRANKPGTYRVRAKMYMLDIQGKAYVYPTSGSLDHQGERTISVGSITVSDPLPDPNLGSVSISPNPAAVGSAISVTIDAKNEGEEAGSYSSITASLYWSDDPDRDIDVSSLSASWAHDKINRNPGYTSIHTKSGGTMTAQNELVEFVEYNWPAGQRRTASFKITPDRSGTLRVRVRTTMNDKSDRFYNDRSSSGENRNVTDQQGWDVAEYDLIVRPPTGSVNLTLKGTPSGAAPESVQWNIGGETGSGNPQTISGVPTGSQQVWASHKTSDSSTLNPWNERERWVDEPRSIPSGSSSITLNRNLPYASQGVTIEQGTYDITLGTTITPELTVRNESSGGKNVTVEVALSRANSLSSAEYRQTATKFVGSGATQKVTLPEFTPSQPGNYHSTYRVRTSGLTGGPQTTDTSRWSDDATLTVRSDDPGRFEAKSLNYGITQGLPFSFRVRLVTESGNPIPDVEIGVEDGIKLASYSIGTTNSNGEVQLDYTANETALYELGVYGISFIAATGENSSVVFSVVDPSINYTPLVGVSLSSGFYSNPSDINNEASAIVGKIQGGALPNATQSQSIEVAQTVGNAMWIWAKEVGTDFLDNPANWVALAGLATCLSPEPVTKPVCAASAIYTKKAVGKSVIIGSISTAIELSNLSRSDKDDAKILLETADIFVSIAKFSPQKGLQGIYEVGSILNDYSQLQFAVNRRSDGSTEGVSLVGVNSSGESISAVMYAPSQSLDISAYEPIGWNLYAAISDDNKRDLADLAAQAGRPLVDIRGDDLGGESEKLIVFFHGWEDSAARWTPTINALTSNDRLNAEWSVLQYNWTNDAATGLSHPIDAAERAYQHGMLVGGKILQQVGAGNLESVHFVGHSAGAWAAAAASRYINFNTTSTELQVTLLDPFIPAQLPFNASHPFQAAYLEDIPANCTRINRDGPLNAEVYWSDDLLGYNNYPGDSAPHGTGAATSVYWQWTQSDNSRVHQVDSTPYGSSNWSGHDGPVRYFLASIIDPTNANLTSGGWQNSLAYHDAQSVATYSISGKVTSREFPHDGISGVSVSTSTGKSATTDYMGRYIIDGLDIGSYTVTAGHPDYYAVGNANMTSRVAIINSSSVSGIDFNQFQNKSVPEVSIYLSNDDFRPGDSFDVTVRVTNKGPTVADVYTYLDLSFDDEFLEFGVPQGSGWTAGPTVYPSDEEPEIYDINGERFRPSEVLISAQRSGSFLNNSTYLFSVPISVKAGALVGQSITFKYRATIGDQRDPVSTGSGSRDQQGYNVKSWSELIDSPAESGISLSGDMNFGEVLVGSESQRTLRITNTGNAPLNVSGINFPEGFSGDWSGTIAADNGRQDVTLVFSPDEEKNYSGTITVLSDANAGEASINADGVGVGPFVMISPRESSLLHWGGSITIDISSNTSWFVETDKPWVSVSPNSGGGNGTVTLVVESNDTSESREAGVLIGGVLHTIKQASQEGGNQPNWQAPVGMQNSMILHATVRTQAGGIVSHPLSLLSAWKGEEIRGVAQIFDGPAGKQFQLNVFSNENTESGLTYRVFDGATGEILEVGPSVDFENDAVSGSIGSPLELSDIGSLTINISNGWNWISTNIAPSDPNVGQAMATYNAGNDDLIKSSSGSTTYFGTQWFPDDFQIETGRLYKLLRNSLLTVVEEVEITGAPADASQPIPLVAGWNWVGFNAGSTASSSSMVHSSGFANDDVVKGQFGSATYFNGQWFGSPQSFQLVPGRGYQLLTANVGNLTYDQVQGHQSLPPTLKASILPAALETLPYIPSWSSPTGLQNSMIVHATLRLDGSEVSEPGSRLAAFDGDEVRGVADIFVGPGGNQFQLNVFSNENSEMGLTLKAFIPSLGVVDVDGTLSFENDAIVGGISMPSSYVVQADFAPVLVSMEINKGALTSQSESVTLDHAKSGGAPTHYRASENSEFEGASWQTYNSTPSFTLSSGNGEKTVYLELKNDAGSSSKRSDTINLDVPPQNVTGTLSVIGDEYYSPAGGQKTFRLVVDYADVNLVGLGAAFPLDSGWSYEGVSGTNVPRISPTQGTTTAAEFLYLSIPSAPASFDFTLNYPAGMTGVQRLDGTVIFSIRNGPSGEEVSTNVVDLEEAVIPIIIEQPKSMVSLVGGRVELEVEVDGPGPFTFEWFRDVESLGTPGTNPLVVDPVALLHAGTYTVKVSNAGGRVTSDPAVLTVVDIAATHEVNGSGYRAGETVEIRNRVVYSGSVSGLGWSVPLPDDFNGQSWSYAGGSGDDSPTIPPVEGDTLLLDFAWITTPSSPIDFSYTLNVPEGLTGDQQLSALVQPLVSGVQLEGLVQPEPLVIPEAPSHHLADTNEDFKFGLTELLRVIELYNTRDGTVRTGKYHINESTVDGFATGPGTPECPPYHSTDTNKDCMISLTELLRMIELYNYREGTVRTGEYHVDSETVDGFAPGPAPAS